MGGESPPPPREGQVGRITLGLAARLGGHGGWEAAEAGGCSWKTGKGYAGERGPRRDRVSGQEAKLLRDRFGPRVTLSGGKGLTREGAAGPGAWNVQKEAGCYHRGSSIM